MKYSIAKKVTRGIFAILFIALAVLFATSYLIVQSVISDKTIEENQSIVRAFADMIAEDIGDEKSAFDESVVYEFLSDGKYICELYGIDFAYAFVPNFENDKIKYLCVAQNQRFDVINPDDDYIEKVMDYTLTDDEKAVWDGKLPISNSVTKSKTGHEISTMVKLEDSYGNKIMVGVDQSYEDVNKEIINLFLILAFIILLVVFGIYAAVYFVIKLRVSKPADAISKAMNEFITDGERSDVRLEVKGNDEFSMISSAFNSMTDDINEYLANINFLTHEQEQQKTQLDISSHIQRGFLKDEYFESGGCMIYADMIPAKYVAGDLYDYMQIGDNKFLIVIADVSGKGVAASIFMAVTLMLIREFAKMNMSPTEILARVNSTLSENNPSLLFSTAIVGIYDSETKIFTYANAGHNLPYVIRNDEVIMLEESNNTFLGIFPEEEFCENTIRLDIGDMLFLYTDGVTEAINENKEFFGVSRLETVLKDFSAAKKENIVDYVKSEVFDFTGEAERFDDITMLCFTPAKTKNIVLEAKESEFKKIKDEIFALNIPQSDKMSLCLASEEFFVNICTYAYENENENNVVEFSLIISNRVTLRFSDYGVPFDPTEKIADIDDYDIDSQIGGLGRYIAVNNIDDAKYEYKNGKNILTLTKYTAIGE